MAAPLIRLEVTWQGSYSYEGKNSITCVEVKQNHSMEFCLHLLAKINKKLPAEQEQSLFFTVKQQGSMYVRRKKSYLYRQFDCPIDLINKLQFFANIPVRQQQNPPPKIYQRRAQISQVAIPMEEIPELDPQTAYQVNIINIEGKLQACLVKKVQAAVAPYLMQEEDPPVGLQEINENKAEEIRESEKEPELDLCSYVCSLSFF